MPLLTILSPAEQVAAHLRTEIQRGTWQEEIPGAPKLARDLGVDPKTVLAALNLLEHAELLVSQGVGRRRRITRVGKDAARPLRIAILLNDRWKRQLDYLGELRHGLVEAGHNAYFARKTLQELRMETKKVSRFVGEETADAWVIVSGSREVLKWCSEQSTPMFALFGRFGGVPIAAALPEKIPSYLELVDELVALGHRQITMLARRSRRLPEPGRTERAFLERLEFHGIPSGHFNLRDWEDDMHQFHALLENLFRVTPPTALIIQEAFLFTAVHHFVAQRGLRVPDDVSLMCSDDDSSFAWCNPSISRIRWYSDPIIHRVINWAAKVGQGKVDLRQTFTKAEWVKGGTIGPARKSKPSAPRVAD